MEIGSKLIDGRYLIQEKLGQGAFGEVFKARDLVSDVDVALKTVPDEVSRDVEELADLKQNFQLVTKLNHPHIANYKQLEYDKGTDKHLLVMEYVEGVSLAQFRKSKRDRKVPVEEAVRICRQISEALDYAHKKSVLHRDIKPKNIRIMANGDVKLLDFGLASEIRSTVMKLSRVVDPNATAGSRPFMGSELFKGKPAGPASDQYALAVLFYELISGNLPFQTDDVQALINAVCNEAHDPLAELTGKQNNILSKALAKDPGKRFPSAVKFATALEKTLAPPSKVPILAALSVLAIVGGLAWWHLNPQSPAPKTAKERTVAELFSPVFKDPKWKSVKNIGLVEEFFGCQEQVYERYETALVQMSGSINLLVRRDEDLKKIFRNDQKSLEISGEHLSSTSLLALSERSHDHAVLVGKCIGDRIYLKLISTTVGAIISKVSIPLGMETLRQEADRKRREEEARQAAKRKQERQEREARQAAERQRQQRAREAQEAAERERKRRESEERTWTDPTTGMKFVKVPGGCFQMASDSGQSDEKPVHEVCVDGFWMGKYEVTVHQYQKCVDGGDCPPPEWLEEGSKYHYRTGSDNHYKKLGNALTKKSHPVVGISWKNATQFAKWLSRKNSASIRLPTEAEWEYACRAKGSKGKGDKYCGGDDVDRLAWYSKNSGSKTHRVGTKDPNGWNLYDMSGNVWEWVSDWYGGEYYSTSSGRNPQGPSGGSYRVNRGGSWDNVPASVRSANRYGWTPGDRYGNLGVRLLRTYP